MVLRARGISQIINHTVPTFYQADDELRTIEMTVVTRPFVLNFAGAKLPKEVPDFDESIMQAIPFGPPFAQLRNHDAGADAQMKMGPGVAPAMKNHALRLAIVVTSVDGYTACFSLAELLSDMGNTAAWIALDLDGKPLPEGEGHVPLITTSDKKPARSVRDIQSINVVDVSK